MDDEKLIRILAKKYTSQPADEEDLLQILRIKKWELKDNPNIAEILRWTAKKWYQKQKKKPRMISWEDVANFYPA